MPSKKCPYFPENDVESLAHSISEHRYEKLYGCKKKLLLVIFCSIQCTSRSRNSCLYQVPTFHRQQLSGNNPSRTLNGKTLHEPARQNHFATEMLFDARRTSRRLEKQSTGRDPSFSVSTFFFSSRYCFPTETECCNGRLQEFTMASI